ncbi:MAG: O-antigen ligase family protein [Magnetococcales bacterium]|nr:O-antigen ligase family protein [Magnetococcales bacterium]
MAVIFLLLIPNILLIDIPTISSSYDMHRIFEILLLCSISLLLLLNSNSRKWWLNYFASFSKTTYYLLISFFLLGLISAIFVAPLPKYAIQEISLFLLLFVLAITLASQIQQDSTQLRMALVAAIFISITIVSWQFVLEYFFSQLDGSITLKDNNFFWRFSNLRFFNQFQTWTFPFLALPFLLYYKKIGHWRILLLVPAIFWWTFWIHSGGRATGVATLIGIVAVLLLFRKKAVPFILFLAGTLLLGLALYFLMFLEFEKSTGATLIIEKATDGGLIRVATKAESQRVAMWLAAFDMSISNPLLGIGPQQFAFYHPIQDMAHPHNAPLQIMAEWGLPAALSIFFLIIKGAIQWITNIKQKTVAATTNIDTYLPMALTASFTAAAAHAQLSGIIVMPVSQFTGVVVIALMLSYFPINTAANNQHNHHHLLLSLFIVVVVTALLWSVFPEITRMEEIQKAITTSNSHGGLLHPRFWQQGLTDLY